MENVKIQLSIYRRGKRFDFLRGTINYASVDAKSAERQNQCSHCRTKNGPIWKAIAAMVERQLAPTLLVQNPYFLSTRVQCCVKIICKADHALVHLWVWLRRRKLAGTQEKEWGFLTTKKVEKRHSGVGTAALLWSDFITA